MKRGKKHTKKHCFIHVAHYLNMPLRISLLIIAVSMISVIMSHYYINEHCLYMYVWYLASVALPGSLMNMVNGVVLS